jgi:hypothetical protein
VSRGGDPRQSTCRHHASASAIRAGDARWEAPSGLCQCRPPAGIPGPLQATGPVSRATENGHQRGRAVRVSSPPGPELPQWTPSDSGAGQVCERQQGMRANVSVRKGSLEKQGSTVLPKGPEDSSNRSRRKGNGCSPEKRSQDNNF